MIHAGHGGAIVVDTGVFGAGLTARGTPLAQRYAPFLVGRRLIITVQTVSELYFGAHKDGWGEMRIRLLEQRIALAAIAPCDDSLARNCADLRLACLREGHALGQKIHTNYLWIAATAVHYDIPLVSDDRTFMGTPELKLLTVTDER